jgi:DNA-binding NtrC family response regulator
MEALVDYKWPGNIRELENVNQGATILADGDSLTRSELPGVPAAAYGRGRRRAWFVQPGS